MTFNLRYDHPGDSFNRWTRRRESVVRLLKEYAPQVVGCQEVTPGQRSYLEAELGEQYACVGVGRDSGGGGEQSLLLYRTDCLELLDWRTYWLSEHPDEPGSRGWDAALPRTCTMARLRGAEGTLLVFNAHLDHRGVRSRSQAVSLLLRMLGEHSQPGEARIVLGDFNALEKEHSVRMLREQMQDAYRQITPRGGGGTFHAFLGPLFPVSLRVDYIFVDRAAQVLESEVVRRRGSHGGYPSDHYPLRARIRW